MTDSELPFRNDNTNRRPAVSVVVPYYNRLGALPALLETVFGQTLTDWELIIVDDASTMKLDRSMHPRLLDPRVHLIRLDTNQGPAAARNAGVARAAGEYIAFLDSDDTWMPNKLQAQGEAAARAPDPASVFCLTRTLVRTGEGLGRLRPHRPKRPGERFDEYIYIEGGFAQTSSFFVSRALANAIAFRSGLKNYEDHLYFIDAGAAGAHYTFVDDTLTIYNDAADPLRLSADRSVAQGFAYLAEAGDRLSFRARLAFETRYLGADLVRLSPSKALWLFLQAVRHKAVKPRYITSLVFRLLLPARAYHRLRSKIRMSKVPERR